MKVNKRYWRYVGDADKVHLGSVIKCTKCGEEDGPTLGPVTGVSPFDRFDRMKHKVNCPVAHIKGGMGE